MPQAKFKPPEELIYVLDERKKIAKAWQRLNAMRREAMQPQPVIIQAASKGRKKYHSGSSQAAMIERCIDYELMLKEWGLDYFQERQRVLDKVHRIEGDPAAVELLYCRFFQGMTFSQIARRLKHSEDDTRRRIYYQAIARYKAANHPEELTEKERRYLEAPHLGRYDTDWMNHWKPYRN